jgi:hypothetical protein
VGDILEHDELRAGLHEFPYPRDDFQLAQDRAISVTINGEPQGGFTCDQCGAVRRCKLAFDWYNTNGDCLAEK